MFPFCNLIRVECKQVVCLVSYCSFLSLRDIFYWFIASKYWIQGKIFFVKIYNYALNHIIYIQIYGVNISITLFLCRFFFVFFLIILFYVPSLFLFYKMSRLLKTYICIHISNENVCFSQVVNPSIAQIKMFSVGKNVFNNFFLTIQILRNISLIVFKKNKTT